jgi:hypothetical protein
MIDNIRVADQRLGDHGQQLILIKVMVGKFEGDALRERLSKTRMERTAEFIVRVRQGSFEDASIASPDRND